MCVWCVRACVRACVHACSFSFSPSLGPSLCLYLSLACSLSLSFTSSLSLSLSLFRSLSPSLPLSLSPSLTQLHSRTTFLPRTVTHARHATPSHSHSTQGKSSEWAARTAMVGGFCQSSGDSLRLYLFKIVLESTHISPFPKAQVIPLFIYNHMSYVNVSTKNCVLVIAIFSTFHRYFRESSTHVFVHILSAPHARYFQKILRCSSEEGSTCV